MVWKSEWTEGRVVDHDVFLLHALRLQVRFEVLVGRAWVDVVGADEYPALDLLVVHQVVDRRDRLLVRGRAGIEDVARRLLTLVLHGVEEDRVQLLEHGEHRLAGHRGPAAEHHGHLVLGDQLAGLLCEKRPIRCRIDHHGLERLPQQAALGVLLRDQHEHHVFEGGLADRHRPGERVQDAHLDGLVGNGRAGDDGEPQNRTDRETHGETSRRREQLHVRPPGDQLGARRRRFRVTTRRRATHMPSPGGTGRRRRPRWRRARAHSAIRAARARRDDAVKATTLMRR